MTQASAVSVSRNDSDHRFEATLDSAPAGFLDYQVRDGEVLLLHTQTDPAFAGRGVGTALAMAALQDIRARGERAVIYCPFIKTYLARHPGEYDDIVTAVR